MLKDYLSKLLVFAVLFWATGTALSQSPLTITAPAGIAGDYTAVQAAFGPWSDAQAADVVLIDDGAGASVGCDPAANDLTGKIALIDRGACGFTTKALNAEAAGAMAVVICNNSTTEPDTAIVMGGSDGCALTIPAVMISYNDCQIIKAELGTGVTATMPANKPADGQAVGAEIALPGAGTYTVDTLTGTGSVFSDAVAAKVYSIVAPSDAVMNVNSCNGGADTRVAVLQGCRNVLDLIDYNDDACDLGTGDLYASSLDVIVHAGETYLIYWDDVWDASGFDFTVSFGALPSVDVSFKVDMQDVTIDPAGAFIVGNFTGITPIAMTDNGDGTWSYTVTVTADDELIWRYMNGPITPEDSPDLAACGVDDGTGGFSRYYLAGLENADLPLVCFNSCITCPPDEACPSWIKEDFEGYALGTIGDQSPDDVWTTWSFAPGGTEDGLVSDEQANSGAQSLKISEAGGDDVLMLLGDRTSGNFVLKWKMYIPTGNAGYYNVQKIQNTPGTFGLQVTMNVDGTGSIDAGAASAATFNYPHDEWFEVYQSYDLDNDWVRLWIAGQAVYEWPASWETFTQSGVKQLGAIDFYGNTSVVQYIDDVLLKQIESCPANAIICDGFDAYDLGNTGPQSPWWSTWDNAPGTVTDGLVTNAQYLSCEQSMEISEAGGDDVILNFGNRTDGNYTLSWDMYVPTGSGGYYNIQKDPSLLPNPAATDFAIQVDMAVDGTVAMDAGAAAAFTFNYPHDEWFNVSQSFDLDNNWATLWINGVQVAAWPSNWSIFAQSGYNQIGGVDFYGNTSNHYFVDNVLLVQNPSVPGNICGGAVDLNSYLGQGMGTTTSTGLFDNTAYSSTALDPTAGYECFGEPDGTGTAPSLENTIWYTFTGDGETYFIETGQCNATNYITDGDTQMAIYSGTCGNLTPVGCNEDSPNATTNNYMSGMELATEAGTVYYMMIDGFNFQGAISAGEYCINFTQLTGPVPTVSVKFGVDLTYYLAAGNTLETVKIAGNFTDNGSTVPNWDPPSSPVFTDEGNDVWSTTIEFPVSSAGQNLEFKFMNTADTWGDCGIQQECMGAEDDACKNPANDNRLLVIPSEDAELCYTWETCVGCNEVATHEFIEVPMTIAPNPFSQQTVVNFNSTILDGQVRLTNLAGQVLRIYAVSGPQLIIDKGDLAPGMYFLNVVTEEGTSAAQKLVVE